MAFFSYEHSCINYYVGRRYTSKPYRLFIFGHPCSLANGHWPDKTTKIIDCQRFKKLAQPSL